MKKFFFMAVAAASCGLMACEKNHEITTPDDPSKEYRFVRVMVSDEVSTDLSVYSPFEAKTQTFKAKYPKSALYTTESQRFAAIIHRENNLTEFFDTGLESHGEHVDIKGTPKFASLLGQSALPTHFKSKKGEVLTFNDGDGTLSIAKEVEMHQAEAKMRTIKAGLLAHHGAMATFSNGTYAITEKDNSVAGALPERVRIINASGQTVAASTIATKGIHGNATDGTSAVFGSASGILVAQSNGNQYLIPHPASFGTAWFGSILETSQTGKFVGYTAAKGAYLIDVVAKTIQPIIENTDIMQCKTTLDLSKLAVLLHSGELRLYSLQNNRVEATATVIAATEKTSKQKPQLVASQRRAYITLPLSGELVEVAWNNLASPKRVKVSAVPYRITLLGFESNEVH